VKALFYPEFGRLCIADVSPPSTEADSAIIRVAACGICGSEIEAFKKRSPRRRPPLVMGHEFCGTVAEIGAGVRNFKVGEKVIAHSLVHCGKCPQCLLGRTHLCSERQVFGMDRPGAFAEYVCVPERSLIRWPETVSAPAATYAEPLANGVHISNLTRHLPLETVLVIGAGPIGLMCQMAISMLRGATVFAVDINWGRVNAAKRLGATVPDAPGFCDAPSWIRSRTANRGVDLVIDAVGSAVTKAQSLACARTGGAVVWIGLHEDSVTLSSYEIVLREKQVLGTYAATVDELGVAAQLLASRRGDIDFLVHSYPLNEGVTAFEDACSGKTIKSALRPQAP
jgi:threonine dehydrogenase-like Zn-dependent dehydrogenase